jgi:tetratricopeptide (TPR) repeat protein
MIKQYPDEASLHLSLGHTMQALERMDDAEQSFRMAIEKAPSSFGGYVALSQLLFKRDRPEEGARILSEATAKVADGADVRRMLGQSELNRNHVPEAIHQFKQALTFDARDSASLFGLAAAQRRQGSLEEASTSLAKLAEIDPTHPGLPLERGMLFEARGDYDAAADSYRKALADRPTDTDLKLRLGAALVTADKVDEADAILQQVLRDRPNSAEAEHYVGRVLFARKDTAQAVQRFERAVSFEPNRAEFHLYLAWASLDQGNLSGALQSVQKAIQLDPALADAYWILGRVQLRTGAVEDALENLQRAYKLKPGRIEALADLGDVYDQLRKLEDAVASYEKAVRARPANGEWWYKLGDLELDRGHRTQARVALSEAVLRGDRLFEKPHWLPEAHRLYAEILREEKRWPEAVEHYRLYLEIAPSGAPDRKEIEQLLKSMQR